jgi:MOSC domain-containing protein YiiM
MVRKLNVDGDGDGQGDLAGHDGERRAVLVYQLDSCRYGEQELGIPGFTFGQFGENFTVSGLADAEVRERVSPLLNAQLARLRGV